DPLVQYGRLRGSHAAGLASPWRAARADAGRLPYGHRQTHPAPLKPATDRGRPTRMPRVSVIIPVFNSSALIRTALPSAFAQTFRNFEVVVVDDGSDDVPALMEALSPWRERIQYVRQANGGPASARNAGIARATGELIAFLDADDEWLSEKLTRQVEYF